MLGSREPDLRSREALSLFHNSICFLEVMDGLCCLCYGYRGSDGCDGVAWSSRVVSGALVEVVLSRDGFWLFFVWHDELESLILAQSERWRHA